MGKIIESREGETHDKIFIGIRVGFSRDVPLESSDVSVLSHVITLGIPFEIQADSAQLTELPAELFQSTKDTFWGIHQPLNGIPRESTDGTIKSLQNINTAISEAFRLKASYVICHLPDRYSIPDVLSTYSRISNGYDHKPLLLFENIDCSEPKKETDTSKSFPVTLTQIAELTAAYHGFNDMIPCGIGLDVYHLWLVYQNMVANQPDETALYSSFTSYLREYFRIAGSETKLIHLCGGSMENGHKIPDVTRKLDSEFDVQSALNAIRAEFASVPKPPPIIIEANGSIEDLITSRAQLIEL